MCRSDDLQGHVKAQALQFLVINDNVVVAHFYLPSVRSCPVLSVCLFPIPICLCHSFFCSILFYFSSIVIKAKRQSFSITHHCAVARRWQKVNWFFFHQNHLLILLLTLLVQFVWLHWLGSAAGRVHGSIPAHLQNVIKIPPTIPVVRLFRFVWVDCEFVRSIGRDGWWSVVVVKHL